MTQLQQIQQKLSETFKSQILDYGLAHEAIVEGQGANYYSLGQQRGCGVTDQHDLVCFFVEQNSTPKDQIRGGNTGPVEQATNIRMVAFARKDTAKLDCIIAINSIPGVTYIGADYPTKSIAQSLWGTPDFDFEGYFFTIDFSVLERIDCRKC